MPKAQTTVPTITVLMDTPEFSKGFVEGLTGEYARFGCIQKPPNEGDSVFWWQVQDASGVLLWYNV